jgi:hypothetical protein
MHNLFHWGDQLNWTPVVWLGIASVALFLVRVLTVWLLIRIYTRKFLVKLRSETASDAENSESLAVLLSIFATRKSVFPAFTSQLYFLSAGAFIVITVWGLISTAWWMLPLGFFTWYFIHLPFRDIMLASRDMAHIFATFQRTASVVEASETLLKGGLTLEQQKAIKRHLGID